MVSLFERSLLLDAALTTSFGKGALGSLDLVGIDDAPETVLTDGRQWAALRVALDEGEPSTEALAHRLTERAEACLEARPGAVTDKIGAPGDVDPRRYRSLAKYWWPDPEAADGLPYVNRDGEVNPEWRDPQFDALRFTRTVDELSTLALAGYLLRRDDCARAAVARLYRWFLDPATGQLPDFSTAQLRPGATGSVRGARTIESRHLIAVCESVPLLEHASALPETDAAAFRSWLTDLRRWLEISPDGRAAASQDNNIGFWYDLQRVVIDQFLGEPGDVVTTLRDSVLPRLARAVDAGELVQETGRARPGQYLAFTVAALLGLSNVSAQHDLDLWGGGGTEGHSLDATLDWVAEQLWDAGTATRSRQVGSALADGLVIEQDPDPAAWFALRSRVLREDLIEGERQRSRQASELSRADTRIAELESETAALGAERDRLGEVMAEHEALLVEVRGERDALRQQVEVATFEAERLRSAITRERSSFETRLRQSERRVEAMQRSTSWRITAPIRTVSDSGRALVAFLVRVRDALKRVERPSDVVDLVRRVIGRLQPPHREGAKVGVTSRTDSVRCGSTTEVAAVTGPPAVSPDSVRKDKRKQRGRSGGPPPGARPRVLRTPPPPPSDAQLRAEYEESGLALAPDTFVLYRVIGNDLPPRHAVGQSRANLEFILEHEPKLPGCEKRWVVNRIVDADEERQIIDLLESHQQGYVRIPFDWDNYATVGLDLDSFPEPGYRFTEKFAQLDEVRQVRAAAHRNRFKNNYVMNNNGARNVAIEDGLARAKWILPWDGNCFVTRDAWEEIRHQAVTEPHVPYIVVPMARITDNGQLLRDGFRPEAEEEPQLIVRADRDARFAEEHYYGRRPKVELFWRLGIPGQWDRWQDDVWDHPMPGFRHDAGAFRTAGWVARLASGVSRLEAKDRQSFRDRGRVRNDGILTVLRRLDAEVMERQASEAPLVLFDLDRLRVTSAPSGVDLCGRIREEAEIALRRGPHAVTDKEEPGPSGDLHDYWHPAPYWWPNTRSADGLPYVRRDGERVPGTVMYEPESDHFDRTRLQLLFDDTLALALHGYIADDGAARAHAASLVHAWFVAPTTRMNPHLRYAQVRRGHDEDEGSPSGIIEFKDVYYFLDGVQLLERGGALGDADADAVRGWFDEYLQWLLTSWQGRSEVAAQNNHGTLYDLQVGAIARFLNRYELLAEVSERAQERLLNHFDCDGRQPHELTRRTTAHYCAFNLQSWVNLASVLAGVGVDLYAIEGADGRGLRRGLEWFLDASSRGDDGWPYQQIDTFDWERRDPLLSAYANAYRRHVPSAPSGTRARFHPHDGIPPFWSLVRGRPHSG